MPEDKLEGEFVITQEDEPAEIKVEPTPVVATIDHPDKIHFYSSLSVKPKGVVFQNQEEGEEIVLLVRRDLITNVPWIVTAVVLIFIPFIIGLLSEFITPFFNVSPITQLVMTLFYYLGVLGFILIEFTLWYFNLGLVTNIRVIDVDVSGILYKHISETRLNIIEDVSYVQVGAIRSLFDYGDVHMQTAGTFANFEFEMAPEPAKVTRIIADMIGGAR